VTYLILNPARRFTSHLAVGAFVAMASTNSFAVAEQTAPNPDTIALATLDGFTLGLEEANQFSGVVLIARNGHVLFNKAYGKTDEKVEEKSQAPVTLDTRFNLASAGKMFTATAILQQIALGRLTLDTAVGDVLKNYPNEEFAKSVTVRHLLTHTGGAGDIDLFGTENAGNREHVHSVADMVALHGARAPAFTPGSKQEYGNFGHVVLGRMVEVLSGEDFEDYVGRHILEPARMTHTNFVACTEHAPDIAIGYATVDGQRVPNCATQPTRGFPAGGEMSTAGDMYRFVKTLQAGKLIPASLFAAATKPHREFMGLGFFATGYGPGWPEWEFRWGHGGSTDGACVDVRTYPKTGETMIVLSNKDIPGCFAVANFLHKQWSGETKAAKP
jgi:D-alanyl-D-alanine carboxypeptidase